MFFISNITDKEFHIDQEETKHITKVLRKNVGDLIEITNGNGELFSAKIISIDKRQCLVSIVDSVKCENIAPNLTMAVAPTKNIDRFEWFVEKAVEIGVRQIIPLNCDHSERTVLKRDRLVKIAISAMKQSKSYFLPDISELTSFDSYVKNMNGVGLFAYCPTTKTEYISKLIQKNTPTTIFIGPEGDFSVREYNLACDNGLIPVSLGPSRLRTETAAVYACSIFQSMWQTL